MKMKWKIKDIFKNNWPLFIILLLALTLRTYSLFIRGDVWFDEWFSIHFSTLDTWKESWRYWVMESNPPFYNFFLRFYLKFVPENILLMRIPSLFFGIGTIAVLYKLTEKIFNKTSAIYTATAITLSGLFIHTSTEIRSYSLLFLLSSISLYLYYLLIIEGKINKKIYWAEYFFVNSAILYTHLTGLMFIFIQILGLILFKPEKNKILKIIIINILSGIIWLTWAIPFSFERLNSSTFSLWYFQSAGNFISSFILSYASALTDALPGKILKIFWGLAWLFLIFLLYKKIKNSKQDKKMIIIFLTTFITLPIFSSTLLGVFVSKYYTCFYTAFFILIGAVISDWTTNYKRKIIVIISFLIIIYPGLHIILKIPYMDYDFAINYIEENKRPDSILITSFVDEPVINYNHKLNIPIIPIYFGEENLNFEEKIVKKNSMKMETDQKKINNWIKENVSETNHIFIIELLNNLEMLRDELENNGWVEKKSYRLPTRWLNYLREFEKNDYQTN